MTPTDWMVVSPSYRRANNCTTHLHFPKDRFHYAVHEFEAAEYAARGLRILVVPDSLRGNIARVRNFILNAFNGRDVLQVDDDIVSFRFVKTVGSSRQCIDMGEAQLEHFVSNGFEMAREAGCSLWGVNCQDDPTFYRQNMPLSFQKIVLGTFSGITAENTLRYDETIPLKEDYDFFIRSVQESKRVLRFNYIHYQADHLNKAGGCQEYRTKELEKDNADALKAKHGSAVKFYEGDTNPVIRL